MAEAAKGRQKAGEAKALLFQGKRVDFHCHAILPAYIRGMERLGIDAAAEEGYPLPQWSAEAHLQFMADAGLDYSVLSLPTPHPYRGDAALSAAIVREINEEMAAVCRQYPDKFGFVAALPVPGVEESLEEIRYAMDELGAFGVKVASNSDGVYLGDARLEPIFEELDRRKALTILHPSPAERLPRENVITGGVMALFEYPSDTTRAVLNLLANGTLERCPSIRLVVPHCGSFLPYMKPRAEGMFRLLAARNMMAPVDLEKSVGNLYFDLAGDPMPSQLDMLLSITDREHIVYGSDYPYVLAPLLLQKKAALDQELEKRQWMEQVYKKNTTALLS